MEQSEVMEPCHSTQLVPHCCRQQWRESLGLYEVTQSLIDIPSITQPASQPPAFKQGQLDGWVGSHPTLHL